MTSKFYRSRTSRKSPNILCELKKDTYVVWYYMGDITSVEMKEVSNLPALIEEGTYTRISRRSGREMLSKGKPKHRLKLRIRI